VEVNVAVVHGSNAFLPGGTGGEAGDSLPQAARRESGARQILVRRLGRTSAEIVVASNKLGADPSEVKLATRSRKGYWRMSSNRIVPQAMINHWLEEQGVPNIRTLWIKLHYGTKARVQLEPPDADPRVRWCGTRG